jgi:hypothetical protein
MHFSCESISKPTDQSEMQGEKHDEPTLSTFCGIEIDVREE